MPTPNPCEKLGIEKDPAKEKRPLTPAEIAYIRFELQDQPEWMRIGFEIMLYHGCRIMSASMDLADVDLAATPKTITFRSKGRRGIKKVHTAPLHPKLFDLMARLKAEGRQKTCEMPKLAPLIFLKFFRRIGINDISSHCCRVTVVTQMAKAGVPIQQAMAYVNHGSKIVHSIYTKLAPQDLERATAAIGF